MTEDQRSDLPEESASETSSRPSPRNPFDRVQPEEDDSVPALIDNRKTAAIYGVVVGLVVLVLVVGLCVATSYAFGS